MSSLYESFSAKNDVRSTFRTTKEILGWSSQGQPSCFLVKGKMIRRPVELANSLQDYFKEKISNLMKNLKKWDMDPLETLSKSMSRWKESKNIPVFNLRQISVDETLKIISGLGNSTAFGRDGIDAMAVKVAKYYLASHICHLVNTSIRMKTFAMKWKTARVIPILKSKDMSASYQHYQK